MIRNRVWGIVFVGGVFTVACLVLRHQTMETPVAKPQLSFHRSVTSIERKLSPRPIETSFTDWAKIINSIDGDTNQASFEWRAEQMQLAVQNVSSNDLAAAFRQLAEVEGYNPTATGRDLQLRLLQRWSEINVQAATVALDQFSGRVRTEACQRLAATWAQQNLAAALDWARQLPPGSDRETALLSIATQEALTDPKTALTLASQVPVPPDKRDLFSQAASTWAASAPEAASTWARQIQDQPLRQQVIAAVAMSWAEKDPVSAAQLIMGNVPAGPAQDNAIMGIVQRMALRDPSAAEAWVQQFPVGTLKDAATAELNRISERQFMVQNVGP